MGGGACEEGYKNARGIPIPFRTQYQLFTQCVSPDLSTRRTLKAAGRRHRVDLPHHFFLFISLRFTTLFLVHPATLSPSIAPGSFPGGASLTLRGHCRDGRKTFYELLPSLPLVQLVAVAFSTALGG